MVREKTTPADIDAFIALYPPDVQVKLQKLRAAIRKAAPLAEEGIKYGMPTFMMNGNLVHFSAWKNHIGFYPRMKAFEKELSVYEGGKGTVKFPMDEPLPLRLIEKMVRFRVQATLERIAVSTKKLKK